MSKLDKLRGLTDNDIGEFTLVGRKTVGKVVDVYNADTCKIIFALDSVILKFNCRLSGIEPAGIQEESKQYKVLSQKARNRLIQLSTDCDCNINAKFSSKEKKDLLDLNEKIISITCEEFDRNGKLLVHLSDINSELTYNQTLIDEKYVKKINLNQKNRFKLNVTPSFDSDTDSSNSPN